VWKLVALSLTFCKRLLVCRSQDSRTYHGVLNNSRAKRPGPFVIAGWLFPILPSLKPRCLRGKQARNTKIPRPGTLFCHIRTSCFDDFSGCTSSYLVGQCVDVYREQADEPVEMLPQQTRHFMSCTKRLVRGHRPTTLTLHSRTVSKCNSPLLQNLRCNPPRIAIPHKLLPGIRQDEILNTPLRLIEHIFAESLPDHALCAS